MRSPLGSLSIDLELAMERADLSVLDRVLLNLYKQNYSIDELEELTELSAVELESYIAGILEKLADELGRDYFDSV